jgi:hypothetical protein
MTLQHDVGHLSSPVLLEKVDKLRDLNIGKDIALPQVRPYPYT